MTKYLLVLFLGLIGCFDKAASDYPTHTNKNINPSELKFKKGDCLKFNIDSFTYGAGVIIDFSKDEAGIWYGLVLTDYESAEKPTKESIFSKRVFGRKVESSLNTKGYETTLDAEFICDSLLANNFTFIGNIPLTENIIIGSHGAVCQIDRFILSFKNGQQRRTEPPDHYRSHLKKLDKFRPDEYFYLKDFVRF